MSSSKSRKASVSLRKKKKTKISRGKPKTAKKSAAEICDLLIIGEGKDWSAPLFAYLAKARGLKAKYIVCDSRNHNPCSVAHLGNGEIRENARLTMGDELSSLLWSLSKSNRDRLRRLSEQLKIEATPGPLLWFARGLREVNLAKASVGQGATLHTSGKLLHQNQFDFDAVLEEKADFIDNSLWSKKLSSQLEAPLLCRKVSSIVREGLTSRITLETDEPAKVLVASIVVIVSETIPVQLFASLRDKLIPVTLSCFEYLAQPRTPDAIYSVFNAGADFSLRRGPLSLLGSFRNLFEDKAVGILDHADPQTKESVRKYFGSLGWIDDKEEPKVFLNAEAISCDGLPIVGSLSENPGVYVISGFAGRRNNFIFEISHILIEGIVGRGGFERLAIFSSRRFL